MQLGQDITKINYQEMFKSPVSMILSDWRNPPHPILLVGELYRFVQRGNPLGLSYLNFNGWLAKEFQDA